MGHKIILCVNERGILLASLCSSGRGSAMGGRGTRGSRRSSEKQVNTQPVVTPAGSLRTLPPRPLQQAVSEGQWCWVWVWVLVLVLAE